MPFSVPEYAEAQEARIGRLRGGVSDADQHREEELGEACAILDLDLGELH